MGDFVKKYSRQDDSQQFFLPEIDNFSTKDKFELLSDSRYRKLIENILSNYI